MVANSALEPCLSEPPKADFRFLETLWFQISGTLCNLHCTHCFISCSPNNNSLEMMKKGEIFRYLESAKKLGVKQIYYTGGEPFIHPDILHVLERTLRDFPTTVLTNGLSLHDKQVDRLKQIFESSRFSLEIRISIDDYVEEYNDAIRGKGTFRRVLAAHKRLYLKGLLPILTASEMRDHFSQQKNQDNTHKKYSELLKSIGVDRPRVKIIPVFEMGMLPKPKSGRIVTHDMMEVYDHSLLQCSSSRIIAHDGVYACPILVGKEPAKMSNHSLEKSLRPCSLYHSSCHTCYVTEMTCKNF